MKRVLVVLFVGFCFGLQLKAQTDTIYLKKNQLLILEDTIIAPRQDTIFVCYPDTKFKIRTNPYSNSQDFYRNLEEKSQGNKITKKLSSLFIVDADKPTTVHESGKSSEKIFSDYKGLTIRSIEFRHVDILEGSVHDTTKHASSGMAVIANRYHTKTKNWVLKSNLTVKAGQQLDPYILSDNERLLRRLLYVEDAKIYVNEVPGDERVDVIIAIKDRFAWGGRGSYNSTDQLNLELFNRSVAGLGRYASLNYYHHNEYAPQNGYNFAIGGQNSLKSITSWQINRSDYWDKKDLGLTVQKDFVTPSVKYGGGIEFRTISDSTINLDGDIENSRFYKLNFQDFWVGRSFQLHTGGERKNITISGRLLMNNFSDRPTVTATTNEIYYNRALVLGQLAYSKQKFIKSSYINGFGISEDIPIGYRISALYGKDYNEFYDQNYFGFNYFYSTFLENFGYVLINQQFGGFVNQTFKTGVHGARVSYYTPLINIGRYKMRNYLNTGYTNGVRQPTARTLSLASRIRDINGDQIVGENVVYCKVESSIYTPWYYYGFRFAPFIYGSVSKIKDNRMTLNDTPFRSTGIGFRVKNESLVFNTFEIRATKFWSAPQTTDDFVISVSVSAPISFENFFGYKPTLIPFE